MSERGKINRRNQRTRRKLLAIDDSCAYCGRRLTFRTSTVDHVIARLWGGQDEPGNLALACKRCNRFKGCDPVECLACPARRGGRLRYVFEVFQVPVSLSSKEHVMPSQKVRFHYDSLNETVGNTVSEHATQIHQVIERTSAGIIEIGKRLLAVRAALTPEQYRAWLIAEFQWNMACATTYETIAAKFGDLRCGERFQPSALYALARPNIDPRVVKEAIRRAERGDTVTRAAVVKLIAKFLPPAPPRPQVAAPRPRETAAAVFAGPVTLANFRSILRRVDVTEIAADERGALANELMELAMQLRTGRLPDGSLVGRAAHEDEESPAAARRTRRELQTA